MRGRKICGFVNGRINNGVAVQKVEDLLTGAKRTQVEEIEKLGSSLINQL